MQRIWSGRLDQQTTRSEKALRDDELRDRRLASAKPGSFHHTHHAQSESIHTSPRAGQTPADAR